MLFFARPVIILARNQIYCYNKCMEKFSVLDLINLDLKEHDALNLYCIGGRKGLSRVITVPDLDRPGLALSGFFDKFAFQRIQVFGRGEIAYLERMEEERQFENLERLFSYDIPCCIFTYAMRPNKTVLELAEKNNCPILMTDLSSSGLSGRLLRALGNIFAPKQLIHGVMMEVFGVGVLLLGSSGVGKSETALELIERKHRLVADDAVEVRCVNGNILMASGVNSSFTHHMEIRGLGLINISHVFGVQAIRRIKRLQLVVQLAEMDKSKGANRLGLEGTPEMELLGVKIPVVNLQVKPGRNIPIIIETAALNYRLMNMGYYSDHGFESSAVNWFNTDPSRPNYL